MRATGRARVPCVAQICHRRRKAADFREGHLARGAGAEDRGARLSGTRIRPRGIPGQQHARLWAIAASRSLFLSSTPAASSNTESPIASGSPFISHVSYDSARVPIPPSLSLSLASSREHAKTRADEEMRTREVFRPGHGHTLGTVNRIEETSQKRAALRTSECHTFWSMAGRSIFGVGLDQHNNQHIGPHLRVYRDIQSSGGSF